MPYHVAPANDSKSRVSFPTKLQAQEYTIHEMYHNVFAITSKIRAKKWSIIYNYWSDGTISNEKMIRCLHTAISYSYLDRILYLMVRKTTTRKNRKAKERAKKRKHYSKCLIK